MRPQEFIFKVNIQNGIHLNDTMVSLSTNSNTGGALAGEVAGAPAELEVVAAGGAVQIYYFSGG